MKGKKTEAICNIFDLPIEIKSLVNAGSGLSPSSSENNISNGSIKEDKPKFTNIKNTIVTAITTKDVHSIMAKRRLNSLIVSSFSIRLSVKKTLVNQQK